MPAGADLSGTAAAAAAASYAAALSGLMSREAAGGGGGSLTMFPGLAGGAGGDPLAAASHPYFWSMYLDKPKSAL